MGRYWQGPNDDRWYLYDDTGGRTKLVHRWRKDYEQGTIHCPDCDEPLMFRDYKARCRKCGEEFKSGWGQVYRVRPFAFHEKKYGRGWKSLRPYAGKQRACVYDGCDCVDRSEYIWTCPICKQRDRAKNMVPAVIKVSKGTWLGKAHLQCIRKYNKTHDTKYSVREYAEDGKFLGEATPV